MVVEILEIRWAEKASPDAFGRVYKNRPSIYSIDEIDWGFIQC